MIAGSALLAPPLARAAAPLLVEEIRTSNVNNKTRLVLDLNRASDFRVFVLGDPIRIVLDLPGADFKSFRSQLINNNPLVKSWRSGALDDGLTRIIFDLRQPVTIDSVFTIPKTSMQKDRLVIDAVRASDNAFNAQKSRVFGNRNLAAGGTAPKTATPPPASAPQKRPAVSDVAVKEQATIKKTQKPAPPKAAEERKIYTIVVDAGHGGEDPGAIAHGVREKDITLTIARELRRQLEETGRYKVVMTRDKDNYIKLYERVDLSRNVRADMFVSIHADKTERTNVRGASIYTLSETASDGETARLAEDQNNAGFIAGVDLSQESQDVADILLDLAMREKMNESNLFARMLQSAFGRKSVKLLPNSHRSAGFAVLKAPDVPSVLIETGFISNQQEAKLLNSGAFQRNIAGAIVEGIDAYFRKIQALQKP